MSLLGIKSATITKKGQIAIPRAIRAKKGFKIGTKIAILGFEDRIEIRPLKQISKKLATTIASEKVLSKDWDTQDEENAWKNL